MTVPTPIKSEIDLDAQGKHSGFLRLPHSVHSSAYGWIPIPIVSIRNGSGPTIMVSAGNHGDEYEGQVIVGRLAREVQAHMVTGHLILLPMANFPAAEAGLRTSPLDDGNLNRSFPGNPSGSPTQIIAHYLEHVLLPRAELLVDLHSGGSSLLYKGANMQGLEPRNDAERERILSLFSAFGLATGLIHAPNPISISSAARRQGGISILTELGGGGMITPAILREAMHGLLHLLGHVGLLHGPLVPPVPPGPVRLMRIDSSLHYVYAHEHGLFEPLVELGDRVVAGQPAARIHFPESPLREPEVVNFPGAGEVVCKRAPARTRRGDCLFQLAGEYKPDR